MMSSTFLKHDQSWMQMAIELAAHARTNNEVPVGAVLVLNNEVIGKGWNQSIHHNDPTAHAEIIALREGAQTINNYRLVDAVLYVTLEPCVMCAGALLHSRIKRLVFGAFDLKAGAIESIARILTTKELNHRIEWQGGLMAAQCGLLLTDFFKSRR